VADVVVAGRAELTARYPELAAALAAFFPTD
jgi:hypothetical protein